jgi:LytS/YehU family sensor histidine kinase
MRLILENSSSEYISLEKEIETLNYYFALQKLRLDDKLSYEIIVDNAVNKRETMLPPMLTQPFIENAIEHGFRGGKEQGKIRVMFSIVENDLLVQVIDNGIGIEQVEKQKELYNQHKSMAIDTTKERLSLLNKAKRKKLAFSISDISNEKNGETGTKVVFSIPLGLQNNQI